MCCFAVPTAFFSPAKREMIGIDSEWRMTWTRMGNDQFNFTNEERLHDGSWVFIDEWRFNRIG